MSPKNKASKPAPPAITAQQIVRLLATRHSEDVFVPECKDGPSGTGYVRLDGWAMKRSWANPAVMGYEIKVSRQDFQGDDKWPAYLPLCNMFSFVCPTGLIQVDELPKEVGLLWVSSGGKMLYTKRKAVYRNVQIPESLFRYILMCRVEISAERHKYSPRGYNVESRREWLAEKDENKKLGWQVSKKIRELVEERIEKVDRQNNRMKEEVEVVKKFRDIMDDLSIRPVDYLVTRKKVEEKFREFQQGKAGDLIQSLDGAYKALFRAIVHLKKS